MLLVLWNIVTYCFILNLLHFSKVHIGLPQTSKRDPFRGGSRTTVTVNYFHKVLHLGCCSSPGSASDIAAIVIMTSRLDVSESPG